MKRFEIWAILEEGYATDVSPVRTGGGICLWCHRLLENRRPGPHRSL